LGILPAEDRVIPGFSMELDVRHLGSIQAEFGRILRGTRGQGRWQMKDFRDNLRL